MMKDFKNGVNSIEFISKKHISNSDSKILIDTKPKKFDFFQYQFTFWFIITLILFPFVQSLEISNSIRNSKHSGFSTINGNFHEYSYTHHCSQTGTKSRLSYNLKSVDNVYYINLDYDKLEKLICKSDANFYELIVYSTENDQFQLYNSGIDQNYLTIRKLAETVDVSSIIVLSSPKQIKCKLNENLMTVDSIIGRLVYKISAQKIANYNNQSGTKYDENNFYSIKFSLKKLNYKDVFESGYIEFETDDIESIDGLKEHHANYQNQIWKTIFNEFNHNEEVKYSNKNLKYENNEIQSDENNQIIIDGDNLVIAETNGNDLAGEKFDDNTVPKTPQIAVPSKNSSLTDNLNSFNESKVKIPSSSPPASRTSSNLAELVKDNSNSRPVFKSALKITSDAFDIAPSGNPKGVKTTLPKDLIKLGGKVVKVATECVKGICRMVKKKYDESQKRNLKKKTYNESSVSFRNFRREPIQSVKKGAKCMFNKLGQCIKSISRPFINKSFVITELKGWNVANQSNGSSEKLFDQTNFSVSKENSIASKVDRLLISSLVSSAVPTSVLKYYTRNIGSIYCYKCYVKMSLGIRIRMGWNHKKPQDNWKNIHEIIFFIRAPFQLNTEFIIHQKTNKIFPFEQILLNENEIAYKIPVFSFTFLKIPVHMTARMKIDLSGFVSTKSYTSLLVGIKGVVTLVRGIRWFNGYRTIVTLKNLDHQSNDGNLLYKHSPISDDFLKEISYTTPIIRTSGENEIHLKINFQTPILLGEAIEIYWKFTTSNHLSIRAKGHSDNIFPLNNSPECSNSTGNANNILRVFGTSTLYNILHYKFRPDETMPFWQLSGGLASGLTLSDTIKTEKTGKTTGWSNFPFSPATFEYVDLCINQENLNRNWGIETKDWKSIFDDDERKELNYALKELLSSLPLDSDKQLQLFTLPIDPNNNNNNNNNAISRRFASSKNLSATRSPSSVTSSSTIPKSTTPINRQNSRKSIDQIDGNKNLSIQNLSLKSKSQPSNSIYPNPRWQDYYDYDYSRKSIPDAYESHFDHPRIPLQQRNGIWKGPTLGLGRGIIKEISRSIPNIGKATVSGSSLIFKGQLGKLVQPFFAFQQNNGERSQNQNDKVNNQANNADSHTSQNTIVSKVSLSPKSANDRTDVNFPTNEKFVLTERKRSWNERFGFEPLKKRLRLNLNREASKNTA